MNETPLDEKQVSSISSAPTPSSGVATQHKKHYWWFVAYLVPLLLVMVIGKLIQIWVHQSCASLPYDTQGECGAGWLQLIFAPMTVIAVIISWIVAAAGIVHLSIQYGSTQTRSVKSMTILLGCLLSIVSIIGGSIISIGFIFL